VTVQLHEGIERPILGIIALFILVGLTKRPGLEVSSVPELGIIPDLGSPAVNAVVVSPCLARTTTRR